MQGQIIDGKSIAKSIRDSIRQKVSRMKQENGVVPGLTVVLVGNDPASQIYVRNKERASKDVGINSRVIRLNDNITQDELLDLINKLNNDESTHGILVQLPLPNHIDEGVIIQSIDPKKDVDGFHPVSTGKLFIGQPGLQPCTPKGIIRLIRETGNDIAGKHAVVIGRSNIVGKPVALMLLQNNATVTICHSKTKILKILQHLQIYW
jgi:methenyltetrahydrofolate cyclohydrolase (EC 3.5.4.9)/5,10-methylenetetrahydrofolate dehydrogenase (NADP+) (EC 1.5.1.5)